MPPLISIITPCLNQASFLSETLASVAAQKGVTWTHLIFDPGSFDGSRELIRAEAAVNGQVCGFFEKDAGPADAINKGIARSQSEFITWLGADDVYSSPHALSDLAQVLRQRADVDVVYGETILVNGSGRALDVADPLEAEVEPKALMSSVALFRRDLLERVGALNVNAGSAYDYEFWLRAARSGARFAAVRGPILRKRLRMESASHVLRATRAMACVRATKFVDGRANAAWIRRAVSADVAGPSGEVAQPISNICTAIARSFSSGHHGEALVLLGNGPSLKGFDFASLRGLDTLGMNAAYRYWRAISWYPRYYACLDLVVGMSHRDKIEEMILNAERLGIEAFLLRRDLIDVLSSAAQRSERVIDFDAISGVGGLMDVHPITTGSHAALFGALLGYKNLLLIGVDGNYVERVEGAAAREGTVLEITANTGSNPNYFFEGYQAPGDRYNIPNPIPDMHLESWRAVAGRLAERGVNVWNGSDSSKVDAFPRRNFERFRTLLSEC